MNKIAKSVKPDEMEGGHKSPPKGYPQKESKYADPVNFKYPIDTEKHARAAWAYIHQKRNKSKYSTEEFNYICGRIKAALKKFKVEIEEEQKKTASILAGLHRTASRLEDLGMLKEAEVLNDTFDKLI